MYRTPHARVCIIAGAIAVLPTTWCFAKPPIREAYFNVYPDALGTQIDTLPSAPAHCGACHYDFDGGGARNPYGLLLEAELPNWPNQEKEMAVLAIEGVDAEGDGFSTFTEMMDTVTFTNTPTFPGYSPANVGSVTNVDVEDVQPYVVPSTGGDTTPPDVEILAPGPGDTYVANGPTLIEWVATDASGVVAVELYLSLDDGSTFLPIRTGLSNTGSYTWYPANRPSDVAEIRVVAIDGAFNVGEEDSEEFSIVSPPGGIVPTTLRDFDLPGTQPFEAGILNPPQSCFTCHGDYDPAVEPYYNWQGSMMAQASIDPLFRAAMSVANQDAPDSGDLCLRCHLPRGWLQGRSVPTDGSRMIDTDFSGVSCDFCHRLVDPIFDPLENPLVDADVLAALRMPATHFGNGMATIDPGGVRRGPFADADSAHPILVSPFHREAALCGTCHDVSNPVFERDENGNYVPNTMDESAPNTSALVMGPVERTYSEWFYSAYNTPEGVFAPQFGGNLEYVSTCQDCHMRDVTGYGCNFGSPPLRDDLPLHDITGGSTWMPTVLATLHPDQVDGVNHAALFSGVDRARTMLQNAADVEAWQQDDDLFVTVTNNTGHKLPTGYPEGRRLWINVRFLDASMTLLAESAAYDPATGVLTHDPEAKIYEVEIGLDETMAGIVGTEPGPTFHFTLNNKVYKDNRIPPRGFANATYEQFGGAPVGHAYADGQYWDDSTYAIPAGATQAHVTLYYQSTSREMVEFLRDENTTDSFGQEMWDLWDQNGKAPPETLVEVVVDLAPPCPADVDGSGDVGFADLLAVLSTWGACEGCPSDIDGNDVVDFQDLLAVLASWGPCAT